MTSPWWRDAVIYQVYPRSFADADGDGVGDIAGVTERLDHLAALGVDGLWLSPFYPSGWADGGYDVADFRDVDPLLGTLADFDALVRAAHDRGLKILIDIVPNHSSVLHRWFQDALAAAPGSPARDRYVFRDGRGTNGELPPTNWVSTFGGPAWTRVADGQWYLHLFAREQPDFNWDNPEVRAEFRDILRFWADRGVDGFRIDVAYALNKDLADPLRDVTVVEGGNRLDDLNANPDHPYLDRPNVHEVYREWRAVLDEYDEPRMAVAETWLPSDRRVRYTRPDELHQAFNFDFLSCPWDADAYRQVIDASIAAARSVSSAVTWVLANHDTVRQPSVLGLPPGTDLEKWLLSDGTAPAADLDLGRRRARAAALLELALPGSAYLYQGEELGLEEVADLPPDSIEDPKYARSDHTMKGRDGCRVPLPWTRTGASLGFGPNGTWLPQPPHWAEESVQAQTGDPTSTLELYRAALAIRRQLTPTETLDWDPHHNTGPVLAFRRDPSVLVLVNTGPTPTPLPPGEILISSHPIHTPELPGNTAAWIRRTR